MRITDLAATAPTSATRSQEISDGLEKAFLREMMKYAGPKPMEGSFGGGTGEEQFSTLMTETYADALAKKLDLGLSKRIGGES